MIRPIPLNCSRQSFPRPARATDRNVRPSTVRRLRWISGIAWIASWRTIYLEIFRWHHMTRTLRFNPPPALPGTDIQPKAGLPLIAACVTAVAAPIVFLTTIFVERTRTDK